MDTRNQVSMKSVYEGIEETSRATYHRGKSWEYCYVFFRNYKKFRDDKGLLGQAALHLGFYLASWGMFRNSFLMEADYRFYEPIIRVLISEKYDALWEYGVWRENQSEEEREQNLKLLFELDKELRSTLETEKYLIHRESENKKVRGTTETLVTKIIMGTMGCVPAYDSNFKKGVKLFLGEKKSSTSSFHPEPFKNLLKLSAEEESLNEIYRIYVPIGKTGFSYPPLKLLDLYFWLRGFYKR